MMSPYAFPGCRKLIFNPRTQTPDARLQNSNNIIETVCKYYGQLIVEVMGKSRILEIVRARQVCMYLIYMQAGLTLTEIAKMFGRDHTTVIHSREKVTQQLTNLADKSWKNDIEIIKMLL